MTERLHVIAGCMFSGKSARLIFLQERAQIAGIQTKVFKPTIDTRWNAANQVRAHNGHECTAIPIHTENPQEILDRLEEKTRLVAIDEVQFFDPTIVQVVKDLLAEDIRVIAAGLPLNFRGEPFGSMPLLLALADYIDRLTAICTFKKRGRICGQEATRTQRLVDGKPAKYDDPEVLIGASESYTARCVDHHFVPGKPK